MYNIGLRSLSHRECGSPEASDTLIPHALFETDPDTTIRWLDVNQTRNKRVKSKAEVENLPADSNEIYYDSVVDDYYPSRSNELEKTHLYDFVRWFEIVKEKPKSENVECYDFGKKKYSKKRKRPHLINHYKYHPEE